jgi:amino acid transporter
MPSILFPGPDEGVMEAARKETRHIEPKLGLWDAVSIIVGIIIGVGIFSTPASIFGKVPDVWTAMGVWVLGGLAALIGALCFAELAAAYPRSGGEYVYITRAFGPLPGFLFAWAQLAIIRPGSIGAVAYIFATTADTILGLGGSGTLLLACVSVALLTFINVMGVVLGAWTQNILTVAKVLGLIALVVVGFTCGSAANLADNPRPSTEPWFGTVMMIVLWTYSGWQEAAYVVSEIKDRRRNISRALLWGTAAVTVIYILVNAAYLYGLGFAAMDATDTPVAAQMLSLALPGYGATAMALLVIISALGAINGMIFTTARIYAEFGLDHRLFSPLSHWSRRLGTPARALVVQGVISLLLIAGVSLYEWWHHNARMPDIGASTVGLMTSATGPLALLAVIPAAAPSNTFDTMLNFTAAVFWFFFLLTGLAFFMLRHIDGDLPRPFRVPLYPIVPLAFCGWCAYMTFEIIREQPMVSFMGLGVLLVGLPFYFWPQKKRHQPAVPELEPVGH